MSRLAERICLPSDALSLDSPMIRGERRFNFSVHVTALCADIVARTPALSHIRMEEVLVTFSQARNRSLFGMQAKLTPLRFRGGQRFETRRGQRYTLQRVFVGEREMRYVLSFFLPRFLDQTFDEKMVTIFHELFHIDPEFVGDVRRFEGRAQFHTHSQKEYDRRMAELAQIYLDQAPPKHLYEFLFSDFERLQQRHGRICGIAIPLPKLIPLTDDWVPPAGR